ncbi:MAG: hypothetical protein WCK67_08075 [bacterium]
MELMTIEDVKNFFKVKKRKTIDDWLNRGVLDKDKLTIKVGGRRFFVKERLIEFLNTRSAS